MSITTVAVEFLGEERLRELSGCENLRVVTSLRFSVDTSENSLGDFGHRLPNLRQLRLDGSNVTTLRDLGTGLGELRILWLARSGLRELEGFGSFGALCELLEITMPEIGVRGGNPDSWKASGDLHKCLIVTSLINPHQQLTSKAVPQFQDFKKERMSA